MKIIVISTSIQKIEQANELANKLLENKLAGCIKIIPCSSSYSWQNQNLTEQEYQITIKTLKIKEQQVYQTIKTLTKYEIPEFIVTSAETTSEYFSWLEESLI